MFGDKEIVRTEGWKIGGDTVKEKEKALCLGMIFEKIGGRKEYMDGGDVA